MITIGDFARLAGVSVRMLRHYDAIGLLTPAHVDPWSGYRRYDVVQLDRAQRLVALKELGFTLTEVGSMLDEGIDDRALRSLLERRRDELAASIEADTERLRQVERRLRLTSKEHTMQTHETALPTLHLAQLTATVGEGQPIGPVVGPLARRAAQAVHQAGLSTGHPSVGWYAGTDGGLRAGMGEVIPDGATAPDGLETHDLPAVTRAIVATHTGSLATIGDAWEELGRVVADAGLEIDGPCREIYRQVAETPDGDWVVELQQPVR